MGEMYDYLCMTKCIFNRRLHKVGEVYTFGAAVKVPEHFKKMGIHKEVASLASQVAVLSEEVERLKEKLIKVTSEKNNLKSKVKG